jgi:hypothetical protein
MIGPQLEGNQDNAAQALGDAFASVRESWEPETTAATFA